MRKVSFEPHEYVRYIPPSAGGDENHPSCKVGVVEEVFESRGRLTVRYKGNEDHAVDAPVAYLRKISAEDYLSA